MAIIDRPNCNGRNTRKARERSRIVEDPDAPSIAFTHWLLFDIPGSVHGIAEGTTGMGVSGRNDFQQIGYGGPCPPLKDQAHRYFFRLYALDVDSLKVPQGATREEVEARWSITSSTKPKLWGRTLATPVGRKHQ